MVKHPPSALPPFLITDSKAAELLARPHLARLLKPFMRGPLTTGQAAQELGCPLEPLHYRVQQLYRAGLLIVVGEQTRRGRASKLYQAVATEFHFSTSLVSAQTLQALQDGDAWYQEIQQSLERLSSWPQQWRVYLSAQGALTWDNLDDRDRPNLPGLLQLQTAALYLTTHQAEQLAQELQGLIERYQRFAGSKRYGLTLTLVPLERPVD